MSTSRDPNPPDRSGRTNPPSGFRTGTGRKAPDRPRWVTAFGIAIVILVAVFLGLHLSSLVPMHDLYARVERNALTLVVCGSASSCLYRDDSTAISAILPATLL